MLELSDSKTKLSSVYDYARQSPHFMLSPKEHYAGSFIGWLIIILTAAVYLIYGVVRHAILCILCVPPHALHPPPLSATMSIGQDMPRASSGPIIFDLFVFFYSLLAFRCAFHTAITPALLHSCGALNLDVFIVFIFSKKA